MSLIWRCLVLLSVGFSTLSAQWPPDAWTVAGLNRAVESRARRRGNRFSESQGAGAIAASYSRYSSRLQSEESIEDQQRECRERADRNGHHLKAEFEFVDCETSGTLRDREGLDALLRAAQEGRFQVLYFFSLSWLARESVISMPVLKDLVYNHKVRVISVSEGVDSAIGGWDMLATMFSLQHEQYIKELSKNVRKGQEGAVGRGNSVGDYCFGYMGEPIPGSEVGRGRNAKPRMRYAIDPERAPWATKIFYWYVVERQSIRWISAELNRLKAPKDHRSDKPLWHTKQVRGILANSKYVGKWPWSRMCNVRDPLTGKVHQEERDASEVEKWTRDLPELRLIDDATFLAAQERLKANEEATKPHRNADGELQGSDSAVHRGSPNTLLSGLFVCEKCEATFYVGGSHGRYLYCQNHLKRGACSCKTYLPITLARTMVLNVISQQILSNAAWFQQVLEYMQKSWEDAQRELPSELESVERNLAEKQRQIDRLLNSIENGDAGADVNERITQRRREHEELTRRRKLLETKRTEIGKAPTEEFLREQLQQLGELLHRANTPAAALALRSLVGGAIVLEEVRHPDDRGGYFRGRFVISTLALQRTVQRLTSESSSLAEPSGAESPPFAPVEEEVVIDFRQPLQCEALADQAHELAEQGLPYSEIAEMLGIRRNRLTMVMAHWYQSRGLKVPDGRTRRHLLGHKRPEFVEQRIPTIMEMYDAGMRMRDIAAQLKVDRHTVSKVIRHGLAQRGEKYVDGRTRSGSLGLNRPHPTEGPEAEDNKPQDDDETPQEDAA